MSIAKRDLDRIKKAVNRTIETGKERLLKQQEEEARRKREQDEALMATAKQVLNGIPALVEEAVLAGKRRAIVIPKIRGLPWQGTGEGWSRPISLLTGWERIVADACREMEFCVDLRPQHDGGGMDAWHELIITW